jgi:hypothetical protein
VVTNNPAFKFEDAERIQCKASIMIEGLTGKGKSGLALLIGYILAGEDWSKVFDIDTENKSANLFAGIPLSCGGTFGKFKIGQLTPDIGFKPTNYLAFRQAAIDAGAAVVIEDSITHAWQYKGGVLDLVNKAALKQKNPADKYGAWRDEDVSREKQELLQLIRDPRVHVITTVRVKEQFVPEKDSDGKTVIVSKGEQQIMQDDIKYEPDLVLHMIKAGSSKNHPQAKVIKSRYAIFTEGETYNFTPELIHQLKAYLEEGADPNELLEIQRMEYVQAITDYLDSKKSAIPIWLVIKEDVGCKDIPLEEMPLDILKPAYLKLIS